MKKTVLLIYALLTAIIMPSQEPSDFDAVAEKIVKYSLEVRPGETVIINGTPAEIKLIEALYVAVRKAGGQTVVTLDLPEASIRALLETPEKYLDITPVTRTYLDRLADCYIYTFSLPDPDLWVGVSEERLARQRKAEDLLRYTRTLAHCRMVYLGQTGAIPTEAFAKKVNIDFDALNTMFWTAMNTDYKEMEETSVFIEKQLQAGAEIKVKTPQGTNLTMKTDNIKVGMNTGRTTEKTISSGPSYAFLPAGEVFACIDETSASGTIVKPYYDLRGNWITNLRLTYKNGMLTGITADDNLELVKKYLDMSHEDAKKLSVIDFGINPDSHVFPDTYYESFEMAGMVTLCIGDNAWAGGNNISGAGLFIHLPDATVVVDNTTLVKDGKLQLPKK